MRYRDVFGPSKAEVRKKAAAIHRRNNALPTRKEIENALKGRKKK